MTTGPDELSEARVLLEEGGLLAVDKPHDLPTSGRSLDDPDCLQWRLMQRAGGMVWAVHQLDADTSGVNLFTTERALVEPLKRAMVEKRYLALVRGRPEWSEVSCAAPLGEVGPGRLGVKPGGRASRTTFRRRRACAGIDEEAWELEVSLHTGRTHQVRIHAAALGHPLVGEEWYVEPPCGLHTRQALHAWRLRLGAPFDRVITAPLAVDLRRLVGDDEAAATR
ncbi:MAG: pseudouridine synthase [Planctomycetota bacterium]|nr:pseudouridine synthase [Planctomycetota bacterium]